MAQITILFIAVLIGLLVLFVYLFIHYRRRFRALEHEHRSMYVKHGKSWEHFVPFMQEFEKVANRENFVFIGMPVDGIAFDENAIKFIEIKTGKSQLSAKQKHIKQLVENKRVEWHELRFDKEINN